MEFLDIRHLQYSEQLKNSAQFSNALNNDRAAAEGSQSGNMADKIREALGTYPEAAITNHGFQEAGKRVYILRASKQELRLSEYDGDWVVLNLTYKKLFNNQCVVGSLLKSKLTRNNYSAKRN